MGLTARIKDAIASAVVALDDLVQDVEIRTLNLLTSTYDTVNQVPTDDEIVLPARAVLTQFSGNEMRNDPDIATDDLKAIVFDLDLAVEPKVDDVLTTGDGSRYRIMNTRIDPTRTVFIARVRAIT